MKRVSFLSDGVTVGNVSLTSAALGFPVVSDSAVVGPGMMWNGSSSSPSFSPGVASNGPDDSLAGVAARVGILETAGGGYVGGTNISPSKLADLLTNFAPAVGILGKYARVSDLYGSVDEILRCRYDGINYRWVPQRENYNLPVSTTAGVVSVLPLFSAPTLQISATLTGNVNVALSTANAYVGQRQTVIAPSSLGLYNMTVTGLVGSGTVPLLQGGVKQFEYGPSGWFQVS